MEGQCMSPTIDQTQDYQNLESTIHSVVGQHHARQVDRLHWTCWHTKNSFINRSCFPRQNTQFQYHLHWLLDTHRPPELIRCWPLASNYGSCSPSKTSAIMGAFQRPSSNSRYAVITRDLNSYTFRWSLDLQEGQLQPPLSAVFETTPLLHDFRQLWLLKNYKRGTWESNKGMHPI